MKGKFKIKDKKTRDLVDFVSAKLTVDVKKSNQCNYNNLTIVKFFTSCFLIASISFSFGEISPSQGLLSELAQAVKNNNTKKLNKILIRNSKIKIYGKNQPRVDVVMSLAIRNKNYFIIPALIQKGSDINKALERSLLNNDLKMTKFFLKKGADPNGKKSKSFQKTGSKDKDVAIADYDPEKEYLEDLDASRPLLSISKNPKIIEALLDAGADPNKKSFTGKSFFEKSMFRALVDKDPAAKERFEKFLKHADRVDKTILNKSFDDYSDETLGDQVLFLLSESKLKNTQQKFLKKYPHFSIINSKKLPSTCKAKNEKVIMPNLPKRSQDGTGLCYGYAALSLIQQLYCDEKKEPCKFNQRDDDRLSVLNAIAKGRKEKKLINGGESSVVLQNLSDGQSIAKEKNCPAPWASPSPQNTNVLVKFINEYDEIETEANFCISCAKFNSKPSNKTQSKKDSFAREIKQIFKLSNSIKEIQETLVKLKNEHEKELSTILRLNLPFKDLKDSEDRALYALDKLLDFVNCKGTEKLPKFSVHSISNWDVSPLKKKRVKKQMEDQVDELLEKERMVAVALTAGNRSTGRRLPHALALQGKREICCNGKCKKQYKMRDSSSFSSHWRYKDDWVDAKELLNRANSINWISKK